MQQSRHFGIKTPTCFRQVCRPDQTQLAFSLCCHPMNSWDLIPVVQFPTGSPHRAAERYMHRSLPARGIRRLLRRHDWRPLARPPPRPRCIPAPAVHQRRRRKTAILRAGAITGNVHTEIVSRVPPASSPPLRASPDRPDLLQNQCRRSPYRLGAHAAFPSSGRRDPSRTSETSRRCSAESRIRRRRRPESEPCLRGRKTASPRLGVKHASWSATVPLVSARRRSASVVCGFRPA